MLAPMELHEGNYEDLVGHALKVVNASLVAWFEAVVPALLPAGSNVDDWAFSVRHEVRGDKFIADLDTHALLDCFLAGWDSLFSALFSHRDARGLGMPVVAGVSLSNRRHFSV